MPASVDLATASVGPILKLTHYRALDADLILPCDF
jgi:hypothetical protein